MTLSFVLLFTFGVLFLLYIRSIPVNFHYILLFRLKIDWMLWAMGLYKASFIVAALQLCIAVSLCAIKVNADLNATLTVDAHETSGKPISETLFGLFFEVCIMQPIYMRFYAKKEVIQSNLTRLGNIHLCHKLIIYLITPMIYTAQFWCDIHGEI